MGTFTVGEELQVADPCYLGQQLALPTPARAGTWHAFIRRALGFRDVSVGLAVVHAVGDRIRHPAFGDGTVKTVLADRKVAVVFAEGLRTVLHAR